MDGPSQHRVEEALRARSELCGLLRRSPDFSSLSEEILGALVDACDLVEVPGGSRLLRAGQPLDSLIAVVHGGLRVVQRTDDGHETILREFHRGDTVGVIGLLDARTFPVDLFAVRDSTLLLLPRARFTALAESRPELVLALARVMAHRAYNVMEAWVGARAPARSARAGNLALLPISADQRVRDTTHSLIGRALAQRGVCHVTAARVDRALGAGSATGDGETAPQVTAWLSDLERDAEVMLYECDPRLPLWTARCRRQSDRLAIVAPADDGPMLATVGRLLAEARPDGLARPVDLILVHRPSTRLPSGTRAWLALPHVRTIHHVRDGRPDDIARVVRRLVGRPVGLVLSGGGARGIAHVGVIAALVEAGVPIDYVCGTSMGSIFAAGLALGFDVPRMRSDVRELFARPFALYDLTLPISSLLAGKKLDRVLHARLGDADIEDLWLPFFCVSTDLAHAELIVHERGCLWKAVRASSSIPGIFPPLPMDGHTLVDGGLVDNLPLDLLAERCAGPIIAVDVFPYGDPSFDKPSGRIARWLRALRTRIRGEPASPPLFDILVRSTLLGSKFRQQLAMDRADELIYLEPPVARFGALEWRSHQALFEAGHRYAAEQLLRYPSLMAMG
jgi:NTE family protein/lysophospholipid hydrolase